MGEYSRRDRIAVMNCKWSIVVAVIFVLSPLVKSEAQSKSKGRVREEQKVYVNRILDDNIKTVECYLSGGDGDVTDYPIKPLHGAQPLVLEFDWMGDEVPYMLARLVHCDFYWEKSNMLEMEYVSEVNEYLVDDLDQSSNTHVPYTHIRFEIPQTKLSGNYALEIYDQDNAELVYLVRRFVVFENKVRIESKLNYSNMVNLRLTNHQLDFKLNYSGVEINNPQESVQVVLMQNGRWDNVISNLMPTAIWESNKQMEYNFFNGENNFRAGSEFRPFDTRSNRNEGLGIDTIDQSKIPTQYHLYRHQPLKNFAYTDTRDMNGRFVISNFNGNDKINSDYGEIKFELEQDKTEEPIYIFGQLSDWQLKPEFMMEYDSVGGRYQKSLLLKQGYYNFLYAQYDKQKGSADVTGIEGSFQQTDNEYIVLVYVRQFGVYYDQVLGYKVVRL